MAEEFGGFPKGARATAVPSLFFTTLLPHITDEAEMRVTLYIFYALGRKRGYPRFVTFGELAADRALATALAPLPGSPPTALRRGLAAAVQRGTLILAQTQGGAVYFLNSEEGRRAAAKAGDTTATAGASPEGNAGVGAAPEPPNIFALYEENIGSLSPIIGQELAEAQDQYPQEWIEAAFREAASLNKRSWRYVAAILQRWQSEGFDYEKSGRDTEKAAGDRFLRGKYGHLIRH